jgi:tetratricopeptide (TPR) repeat protein
MLSGHTPLTEAVALADALTDEAARAQYRDALGDRLREQGRHDEALAQYRATLDLEPDNPTYRWGWVNALFPGVRVEEALGEALRAVESAAEWQRGWMLRALGDRLRERGRHDEALAQYRAAVDLEPDNPTFRQDVAKALFDLDRVEEALGEALRAVESAAEWQRAWMLRALGDRLRERGRHDEALAQYRAAVDLEPDNPTFRRGVARALLDSHRIHEAMREYANLTRRHPEMKADYARVLLMHGNPRHAISLCREAAASSEPSNLRGLS